MSDPGRTEFSVTHVVDDDGEDFFCYIFSNAAYRNEMKRTKGGNVHFRGRFSPPSFRDLFETDPRPFFSSREI